MDSPAYGWRGVLLDEGRHFFGKETVRNLLDLMAMYKMNVFHWHLTEDQGWRIDVPKYPKLAQMASMRLRSPAYGSTLEFGRDADGANVQEHGHDDRAVRAVLLHRRRHQGDRRLRCGAAHHCRA